MTKNTSRKTASKNVNLEEKKDTRRKEKLLFNKELQANIKQRELESLEERLQFETLLADISAYFINLPSDQVDNKIESAMRDVCKLLGLDLSALWQLPEKNSKFMTMTHLYRPLGGPPVPDKMDAREYFPWSLQQVMANKVVILSSIDKAPAEASRDKEVWRHYGIKTTLTFPLSIGSNTPFGAISFNTVLAERSWPEEIVKRLQLVAQIFANALIRKFYEDRLRQSEERLMLATEAADTGLWILNVDTGKFWCTEKARELFSFAPDIEITMDSFLCVVHTEDRERIRQAVKNSLQERSNIHIEYRVVHPDRSIRWIVSWGKPHKPLVEKQDCMMGVSLDITDRKNMENQIREQLKQIRELQQNLERENIYLKAETNLQCLHEEIIGESEVLKRVLLQVEKVAPTESIVLITGETGTGKELIARAIHCHSKRSSRLLVKVDCASLPSALIESELFGREKGAYTGALTKQIGRFELADGSTIFLDEIGELPLELQAKLLRVLQNGEFERLGSPKTIYVNVRVIAATNRNLEEAVKKGTFREDLYYRLKVFPIQSPPLRDHPEDIPLLVHSFINEFCGKMGKKNFTLPESAMAMMKQYHWPGNVRELRNIIEQAVIISHDEVLEVNMPHGAVKYMRDMITLEEAERHHIICALEKSGWRIKGRDGAAELLGLKPSTLYTKMEKLGIPTHREKDGIAT